MYSREHTWTFDGGVTVPASPSPAVVPKPYSNVAYVDPEEAFVAAIASCHMLTYLFVAAKAGIQVERYEDEAVGAMTKNEHGVPWVSTVVLRPRITYGGATRPAEADEDRLHHEVGEARHQLRRGGRSGALLRVDRRHQEAGRRGCVHPSLFAPHGEECVERDQRQAWR
jgi:organic hydroperoxide reductase OsmC/OhrA